MVNYDLVVWLAASVVFSVIWNLSEQSVSSVAKSISTVLGVSIALQTTPLLGWIVLVLLETSLFLGKNFAKKPFGMVFVSVIPGALLFYAASGNLVKSPLAEILIALFLYMRAPGWPMTGLFRFKNEDAFVGVVSSLLISFASLFLLFKSGYVFGVEWSLALLLLCLLGKNLGGAILFSWLIGNFYSPDLGLLGLALPALFFTSGWQRLLAVLVWGLAWVQVPWPGMLLPQQAMFFLAITLSGMSLSYLKGTGQKDRLSVSALLAFLSIVLAVALMKISGYQGVKLIDAVATVGALAIGLFIGWLLLKYKIDWQLPGFNLWERIETYLNNSTIAPESDGETERILVTSGAARVQVGEVAQYVVWLVLILTIFLTARWIG